MPDRSDPADRLSTAPGADELEVTVIGPGFGEAILVHVGDNRWIVVDSCSWPESPAPAPLEYLAALGVGADRVEAVVVSHWDDDHCRGIAKVVEACGNATVVMATAFVEKDFLAFVASRSTPLTAHVRSGVKEIRGVTSNLDANGRAPLAAFPARRLFGPADLPCAHALPVEIWSLTPSDDELANFQAWAASQMPKVGETRRVAIKRLRNDLSVVLHVSVGQDIILLGGDLEEEGKPTTGWSAVLALKGRPTSLASVFKVPHHGSETGHHHAVPATLLAQNPLAVVAPFRNGSVSLPTKSDVDRIRAYAPNSFATATLQGRAPTKRDSVVEKTIREVTRRFSEVRAEPGIVRLRKPAGQVVGWQIERFGTACPLERVL